ncbi:MAG: TGS domain-containing protein [Phycisphaerae bacterium]|nr:TGS domain-containing protein [Phycisphaerae bacterium]
MALNLTPDYFEADRKYRQARTPEEKLAALEEMLRTIPKHKASEKKQSDIKRRISELRQAPQTRKKGGTVDPYHIPPQGAGQALLLGLPNSGKSSIVARLTKATVKVTDFPFGTALPVPGMAYHEDVPIELVDLPPVTVEHVPSGLTNALRNTHVLLLVVDLAADAVLEDIEALLAILREREIILDAGAADEPSASRDFDDPAEDDADEEAGDSLHVGPQGLIVCTKADLPGADDNWAVLQELRTGPPPMLPVSSVTGQGLDDLLARVFGMLDVVRVYAKPPGKPADKDKPFILPTGSTVGELARMIHKEIGDHLKFARVWGTHAFDGQQVHANHVLYDRDVVELHT